MAESSELNTETDQLDNYKLHTGGFQCGKKSRNIPDFTKTKNLKITFINTRGRGGSRLKAPVPCLRHHKVGFIKCEH